VTAANEVFFKNKIGNHWAMTEEMTFASATQQQGAASGDSGRTKQQEEMQ